MSTDNPIIKNNKNLRTINTMIKKHFDASEEEMTAFNHGGGVIKDEILVDQIHCPVCGNNNSRQLLVKWGGRYDECKTCSHVFLKNPFKQEILTKLYKSSIVDQLNREVQKHSFNEEYWAAVYKKYMNMLMQYIPKNGKLLDVGCGTGRFLSYCKDKFDLSLYAVDVYEDLIKSLSPIIPANNIFYVDAFEDSNIELNFNVATMWGVLEHCRSPHKILSKCNMYLEEGGIVLMLIPNIHSRARTLLGVNTPTLNPREHINFFTHNSLEIIANKSGFEIMSISQELPIIDLMWPYIDDEPEVISDIVEKRECYYYVVIMRKIEDQIEGKG